MARAVDVAPLLKLTPRFGIVEPLEKNDTTAKGGNNKELNI